MVTVSHRNLAGCIQTDEIARHNIAHRLARHPDAVVRVSGDDISLQFIGQAIRVRTYEIGTCTGYD